MGHVQVPFSCFLKILEIGTVMPQQIGDNYLAFVRDLKLKLKIKKNFPFQPYSSSINGDALYVTCRSSKFG